MNTTQLTKFKAFLNTLDCEHIDLAYYATEDTTTFDELRDAIDNGEGFNVEIIYYSRAMEFLTENDTSLNISMGIAHSLGYEAKNINSELLASLLASEKSREEFDELGSQITDFLEELLQEEERKICT